MKRPITTLSISARYPPLITIYDIFCMYYSSVYLCKRKYTCLFFSFSIQKGCLQCIYFCALIFALTVFLRDISR